MSQWKRWAWAAAILAVWIVLLHLSPRSPLAYVAFTVWAFLAIVLWVSLLPMNPFWRDPPESTP